MKLLIHNYNIFETKKKLSILSFSTLAIPLRLSYGNLAPTLSTTSHHSLYNGHFLYREHCIRPSRLPTAIFIIDGIAQRNANW